MKSTWGGILASIFLDFDRFGGASWEEKWNQDRPKKASKKRWKQRGHQDDQKVAIRRSNPTRRRGSWVLGRGDRGGWPGNPSPKEERKGLRPVLYHKPPKPRGLVRFSKNLKPRQQTRNRPSKNAQRAQARWRIWFLPFIVYWIYQNYRSRKIYKHPSPNDCQNSRGAVGKNTVGRRISWISHVIHWAPLGPDRFQSPGGLFQV